jgi:hypothetical protein
MANGLEEKKDGVNEPQASKSISMADYIRFLKGKYDRNEFSPSATKEFESIYQQYLEALAEGRSFEL